MTKETIDLPLSYHEITTNLSRVHVILKNIVKKNLFLYIKVS